MIIMIRGTMAPLVLATAMAVPMDLGIIGILSIVARFSPIILIIMDMAVATIDITEGIMVVMVAIIEDIPMVMQIQNHKIEDLLAAAEVLTGKIILLLRG